MTKIENCGHFKVETQNITRRIFFEQKTSKTIPHLVVGHSHMAHVWKYLPPLHRAYMYKRFYLTTCASLH